MLKRVYSSFIVMLVGSLFAASAPAATPQHAIYLPSQPLHITREGEEIARIQAEIASTSAERRHGLMFRETLPLHNGMLFIYEPPEHASMWMKNTLIPLDMLFIDAQHRIVHIHHNATPHALDIITANRNVWGVLELKGGAVETLGIQRGDIVKLENKVIE